MNQELRRFFRFVIVGCLNTAVGYAVYSAFILTGLPLWLCVTGATIVAVLFNFGSYGKMVFGTAVRSMLPRFLVGYAAIGAANFLLLRGLAAGGVGPFLGQAVLLPLLALLGYTIMRFWVYRRSS